METLTVALLTSSMFFSSPVVEVGDRYFRIGFTDDQVQTKIDICESKNMHDIRFWFDDESRPWRVTRMKCTPENARGWG